MNYWYFILDVVGITPARARAGYHRGFQGNTMRFNEWRGWCVAVVGCILGFAAHACDGASTPCFKPSVQVAKAAVHSRYVYELNLAATLPGVAGVSRRTVLTASSQSGLFSPITLHPVRGWISDAECGTSATARLQACGWPSGPGQAMQIGLSSNITNAEFSDLDLIVTYMASDGNRTETGYMFQCLRFAGMPFCLTL